MGRNRKAGAGRAGAKASRGGGAKGSRGGARTSKAAVDAGGAAQGEFAGPPNEGAFVSFRGQPVPIEADLARDLLGDPIRPGAGRRGRPVHLPTPETRARVVELREAGAGQDAIAAVLGISGPTLRLNYAAELQSRSTVWQRRAAQTRTGKAEGCG